MALTKAPKTPAKAELPTVGFDSPGAWNDWLEEHHASSRGIWLKFAKKDSGIPSPTYAEALKVALCWGWIDGQKRGFDDRYWLQRFTPRGKKSLWSRINCAHVEGLIAAGEMRPAGLAQVEAARADGRWDAAYAGQKTIAIPEDLAAVFAAEPKVAAHFASLASSQRYAFLYRLETARKPETRQKRFVEFVALLRQGKKLLA
jgi:uncharacterized protein YdeI (YjbR/CyaY-like superfamily)